jgi:hypothetical protein
MKSYHALSLHTRSLLVNGDVSMDEATSWNEVYTAWSKQILNDFPDVVSHIGLRLPKVPKVLGSGLAIVPLLPARSAAAGKWTR